MVDPTYMDTTAKACTDFFQYSVGGWLKHDTIPPDYSYSGVGRDMEDRNELVVRSVLEDAASHRASGARGQHRAASSAPSTPTCMGSTAAEQSGVAARSNCWIAVAAARTKSADLLRLIAANQEQGASPVQLL